MYTLWDLQNIKKTEFLEASDNDYLRQEIGNYQVEVFFCRSPNQEKPAKSSLSITFYHYTSFYFLTPWAVAIIIF